MAMAAIEQYFPEDRRIIDDPLARPILPLGMRSFVSLRYVRPTGRTFALTPPIEEMVYAEKA